MFLQCHTKVQETSTSYLSSCCSPASSFFLYLLPHTRNSHAVTQQSLLRYSHQIEVGSLLFRDPKTTTISTTMMECSDPDDITVQSLQQTHPFPSTTSFKDRRANRTEKYFTKIPQSKAGETRACFSLNDNSEHEIVLCSSNLYSLHNYSPEMKENSMKHRGEQIAASLDGYRCCGCSPEWWDEVEDTLKCTLMSIKHLLNGAFK